jgi:hypothetical protein
MLIKDFIQTSIQQIRSAVDSFNNSNEKVKAQMPTEIEFDLAITLDSGIPEVMELGRGPKEATRIKIKVNQLQYLWLKEDVDPLVSQEDLAAALEKRNKEKQEGNNFGLFASVKCKECFSDWSVGANVFSKFKHCPVCKNILS